LDGREKFVAVSGREWPQSGREKLKKAEMWP